MMTLYTFLSVHHLIRAEKVLKDDNITCDVIPTPRAISTSCGLCMVVATADTAKAEAIFRQADIVVQGLYKDAEKQGLYKGGGAINV